MTVTTLAWAVTLSGLSVVVLFDLWVNGRGRPGAFTARQAATWVTCYVVLAIGFGTGVLLVAGGEYAGQFFAGYLTEYSLSVDNLVVFFVVMARFAVPRAAQHRVLLVGILIALVMRGAFIAAGAAVLSRFSEAYYLFGGFLLWSAWGLLRGGDDGGPEFTENRLLRWARRVLPTTRTYHGRRLTVRLDGRRRVTPVLLVMIAIGTTDLLFALDSIPAIFGLTRQAYLVFTANAFALMGLRQLYFLLGGLLQRLPHLSKGLAAVLTFIGIKLVMQAMHDTGLRAVPLLPSWLSLAVIGTTMLVTALAGPIAARRGGAPAVPAAMDAGTAAEQGDPPAHRPARRAG